MRQKFIYASALALSTLFCLLCGASAAAAQTTSFTYQGRLSDAGAPASGTYDMKFRLYDSGGNAQGSPNTVTLDNPSPVAHDIEIEGNGVEEASELVTDGTASVTADLERGEYTYYCTVPGHEDAGMKGVLTVS